MERKPEKRINRKKKKLSNKRKFVNFMIIIILISITYFTTTLIRNKIEYNRMNKELDALIIEREELEKEIESLEKDYKDKESLEFAERVAREKLGMIKAKEYMIKSKTEGITN